MGPRDFHKLASRLAQGNTPAEFRTAIGRSYYSVFNVGVETLLSLGFRVSRGAGAHGEVHKSLMNSGEADISGVGWGLARLQSARIRADYQMGATDVDTATDAKSAVTLAGEMIRTLDSAFSGPRRAQLQAAIARWHRDNGYP